MIDPALLVLTTAPDEAVAATLARGLVQQKLAACVNVLPGIRSFYEWKGELHEDREVQLLIKSRRSRFEALQEWLLEHHPYDVPEVIALPIERGSDAYMEWLHGQTTAPLA